MTAIVTIGNKNWIAIAADSAGSVWSKVFMSNKLFWFKERPIWVATYGNSEFMDIPIEILIQEFIKKVESNSSLYVENLGEYKYELIQFLKTHWIINETYKDTYHDHIESIIDFVLKSVIDTHSSDIVSNTQFDEYICEFLNNFIKLFTERFCSEEQIAFDESIKSLKSSLTSDYIKEILATNFGGSIDDFGKSIELLEKLIVLTFDYLDGWDFFWAHHWISRSLGTGIIFAGYWDKDIYPSVFCIELYFFFGEIFYKDTTNLNVTRKKPSVIEAFAQWDAIVEFAFGIHPRFENNFRKSLFSRIWKLWLDENVTKKVWEAIGQSLMNTKEGYTDGWLLFIIKFLWIKELADTAETLINLTSFWKRVRMWNEDVWWPTDVLLITKNGVKVIKSKIVNYE